MSRDQLRKPGYGHTRPSEGHDLSTIGEGSMEIKCGKCGLDINRVECTCSHPIQTAKGQYKTLKELLKYLWTGPKRRRPPNMS